MSDIIGDREKFKRGWEGGLPETPCGSGSRLRNTARQRAWIPAIVAAHRIRTIADIGAGDLNWMNHIKLPDGVEYRAYDLVPRRPDVQPFDLVAEVAPKADLLLCLWVLNHLPFDQCRQAIENLKASGSTYLAMTDRPRWRQEQPPEIRMPYIASLDLGTPAGDSILLIDLRLC